MVAVASLLIILTLSFFITRVATIALSLTGLSHDLARFQAVSAFTGVGYTTAEAERTVNHPVRRQIVMVLMIFGNAGIVTAVSSLILSFTSLQDGQWWMRAAWIGGGVVVLWLVRSSKSLGRWLDSLIRRVLTRTTELRVQDYRRLLHLGDDYEVRTLEVESEDWLCNRPLCESRLFQEGIVVLGVHRPDGEYLGVPRGETEVRSGDRLVLYGAASAIEEIDRRRRGVHGDDEHARAVRKTQADRKTQAHRETQADRNDPKAREG